MSVGGPELAAQLRRAALCCRLRSRSGWPRPRSRSPPTYAKDRTQFGKAIGSFQAVKHLLADAQVQVEVARAAVQAAGRRDRRRCVRATGTSPGRTAPSTVARIVASRAADRATRACVQVHGGIGFTWELDAHLFLKRALVLDVGLGTPEAASDALAASL